jgi:hypothetical protein
MFYRFPGDHTTEDGVIATATLARIHLENAFDAYICFDKFVNGSEDVLVTGDVI